MYWSKARAKLLGTAVQGWKALRSDWRTKQPQLSKTNESHPVPEWDELVAGLAQHLKVYEPSSATEVNELYVSHALIVRALNAMTAVQRKEFFDRQVDFDAVIRHGAPKDNRFAGPARTVTALGAANAAGFSLYAASTTALGFVTHAVGITLPFAAFTGLTSSIAFLIGPAGWLSAGAYAFWKATSTNWKELAPAIIYVINARAAKRLDLPVPSTASSN